ncbi:MAG: phage tail protein [Gammaproteobacteria bacterium]|nr:MAG: phage tail protein [Gammaproteobacteria bacterium]
MSKSQRIAGIFYVKIDGILQSAKGNFTYNLGAPKRSAVVGTHKVHGFKEEVQVAFLEGEFTDSSELDLEKLVTLEGVDPSVELANGKVFVLRNAWYAGEGTVNTDEANVDVRFEADKGEEIR